MFYILEWQDIAATGIRDWHWEYYPGGQWHTAIYGELINTNIVYQIWYLMYISMQWHLFCFEYNVYDLNIWNVFMN